MRDHLVLTEVLQGWGNAPVMDLSQFTAEPYKRLGRALQSFQRNPHALSDGDVLGLTRTVLMYEKVRSGQSPELVLPAATPPFPTEVRCQDFGLRVVGRPKGGLKVTVDPWKPGWLEGAGECEGADWSAYESKDLRVRSEIPVDPALRELTGARFGSYRSPGQAMAVRAAFLSLPGTTLLVNLPTGQGKSLVFQGLSLAAARKGQLSVIVVPTTALAKDHERRFWEEGWSTDPIAYHGGLTDAEKKDFKSRIRDGTQLILAASPEAIFSGLRLSLLARARVGEVHQIVIDEAHLIDQWGTEFRPEFQFLAGFRDLLVEASPRGKAPKTLLLSATITAETNRTLRRFFGDFDHVSAVHLRPEPEFWIAQATDDREKVHFVREAIRHLPRPFLLYTSTRRDAQRFFQEVREQGILRVQKVVGGTALDRVLQLWSDQDLDVIVATSAFGLGVDNNQVRAVLHACIPETADRFYQEVGRGGRDGRHSISLTVFQPRDWDVAEGLANPTVIRKKGWPRWEKMWAMRGPDPRPGHHRLDIRLRPPNTYEDSDVNRKWNQRTLGLMARSGLVELKTSFLELLGETEFEDEAAFRDYLDKKFTEVPIQLLNPEAANDQGVWEEQVFEERERARKVRERSLRHLREIFLQEKPVNDVFEDVYSFDEVEVQKPIGRCPATRKGGRTGTLYALPCPAPPRVPGHRLGGVFQGPQQWPVYVAYDQNAQRWEREALGTIELAVRWGFSELLLPRSWMEKPKIQAIHRTSPTGFVCVRDLCRPSCPNSALRRGELPLPRVVLIPPGASADDIPSHALGHPVRDEAAVGHLVIFEREMPWPEQAGWLFRDQVPITGTLTTFFNYMRAWQS